MPIAYIRITDHGQEARFPVDFHRLRKEFWLATYQLCDRLLTIRHLSGLDPILSDLPVTRASGKDFYSGLRSPMWPRQSSSWQQRLSTGNVLLTLAWPTTAKMLCCGLYDRSNRSRGASRGTTAICLRMGNVDGATV